MAHVKLRDYQQEALESVQEALKNGIYRQLIVLPTGAGKTIIMASIARHFDTKVLLLAHRQELITQAVKNFKLYWPNADIGICKAKRNEIDRHIVIGSIQSCYQPKRLKQLQEQGFSTIQIVAICTGPAYPVTLAALEATCLPVIEAAINVVGLGCDL